MTEHTFAHLIASTPESLRGWLPIISRVADSGENQFMAKLRNWETRDGECLCANDYSATGATEEAAYKNLIKLLAFRQKQEIDRAIQDRKFPVAFA